MVSGRLRDHHENVDLSSVPNVHVCGWVDPFRTFAALREAVVHSLGGAELDFVDTADFLNRGLQEKKSWISMGSSNLDRKCVPQKRRSAK